MVDRTLASALRSIRDRLTRLERRLGGQVQVWRRRGPRNARLAILPFGNEGLDWYQTDGSDRGRWTVEGGQWIPQTGMHFSSSGSALAGADYDGVSPIRIATWHTVLTATNGDASFSIAGLFPNGLLSVQITLIEAATIGMVRHSGQSPATTLDTVQLRIFSASGSAKSGLFRFTALLVGW